MGNSRAQEATATFLISDGVLYTDDLIIHGHGFRLLYRGSIDQKEINATVEARLLGGTPLVGKLLEFGLSPLSKLFEAEITGPVSDPRKKLVFLPKPWQLLFHPLAPLKALFPSNPGRPPAPLDTSTATPQ